MIFDKSISKIIKKYSVTIYNNIFQTRGAISQNDTNSVLGSIIFNIK